MRVLGQRASNQYSARERTRWSITETVTSQTVHELRGHAAIAHVVAEIKRIKYARKRQVFTSTTVWHCANVFLDSSYLKS